MKPSRLLAVAISILLFVVSPQSQSQSRRDGNWWRSLDRSSQLAYVAGALDGQHLGYWFATEDFRDTAATAELFSRTSESHKAAMKRYVSKVSVVQVADGLDALYADFRNRSIPAFGANWIVLSQIAGTPDIEKVIESWRRYTP